MDTLILSLDSGLTKKGNKIMSNLPHSEVYYDRNEIRVYWGEWSYTFTMNSRRQWHVKVSAIPVLCSEGKPFLSDPFGR